MSASAPHLEAVPPEAGDVGEERGAHAPTDEGASRIVPIVLAILLGLALVLLAIQYQRGQALVGQVVALESELAATQASLDAHRAQLRGVRTQVGGVRAAMTELQGRIADLDASAALNPVPTR